MEYNQSEGSLFAIIKYILLPLITSTHMLPELSNQTQYKSVQGYRPTQLLFTHLIRPSNTKYLTSCCKRTRSMRAICTADTGIVTCKTIFDDGATSASILVAVTPV